MKLRITPILTLILFTGCVTSPTSNQTYGTSLSAKNNAISLSLAPDYPYLNQLGNGLKLRATYQVQGQRVSEVITTSKLQGVNLTFIIPDSLGSIPDNQVCLQLEPITPIQTKHGKISILPIRRVNQNSKENAVTFRYPTWESNVKNVSLIKEKERELSRLESLLSNSSNNNTAVSQSCDDLKVKDLTYDEPRVKNKSGFDEESKLVCIWKVQTLKTFIGDTKLTDELMSSYNMKNLTGDLRVKGEIFRKDWNKYSTAVRKFENDPNRLGSEMLGNRNQLITFAKYGGDARKMTNEELQFDLRNIIGQYADLYDTCKRDVYVQLEKKLDAWNMRKDKQHHEDEEYLKIRIAECKASQNNQSLRDEKTKNLINTVELKRSEIAELRSNLKEPSNQSTTLNGLSCSY